MNFMSGHLNMNGLLSSVLVKTPTPPYYAVIFSALQSDALNGYSEMAEKMVELASKQDGFIGVESAEGEIEITISYWKDEASIQAWKSNLEHKMAQKKGKKDWYDAFEIRVAKVERAYSFKK